jgi:hypothetical protein
MEEITSTPDLDYPPKPTARKEIILDVEKFINYVLNKFRLRKSLSGSCWELPPYGMSGHHNRPKYGGYISSRAAWFAFKGFDPAGDMVCHTCDNCACVNPDHLFLGNNSSNRNDHVKKGRHRWKTSMLRSIYQRENKEKLEKIKKWLDN